MARGYRETSDLSFIEYIVLSPGKTVRAFCEDETPSPLPRPSRLTFLGSSTNQRSEKTCLDCCKTLASAIDSGSLSKRENRRESEMVHGDATDLRVAPHLG